jgi:plasmid stabilization system protein ParE
VIVFTRAARRDLAGIFMTNRLNWGGERARSYSSLLIADIESLVEERWRSRDVESREGVEEYVFKFNPKRSTYGHRVLFRRIPEGIRVLRILHTAMDWPAHLDD